MAPVGTTCARCSEPLYAGAMWCGLCGAASGMIPPATTLQLPPALMEKIRERFLVWRSRYGTLPLIALLGVLPFFPLTPVVGIAAGGLGLHRISRRGAPEAGRSRAILGLIAGLLWLAGGIMLLGQAADFIRDAPFLPSPLKWFWNWPVVTTSEMYQA